MNSSAATSDPNEAPMADHICNICKQAFTKRGLTVHMNRHTNEANDQTANRLRTRLNTTERLASKNEQNRTEQHF